MSSVPNQFEISKCKLLLRNQKLNELSPSLHELYMRILLSKNDLHDIHLTNSLQNLIFVKSSLI
jgi:hypothetical protein